ncbi:MAG: hypothetical protein ACQERO_01230 [Bacteroidota bacterium]
MFLCIQAELKHTYTVGADRPPADVVQKDTETGSEVDDASYTRPDRMAAHV